MDPAVLLDASVPPVHKARLEQPACKAAPRLERWVRLAAPVRLVRKVPRAPQAPKAVSMIVLPALRVELAKPALKVRPDRRVPQGPPV